MSKTVKVPLSSCPACKTRRPRTLVIPPSATHSVWTEDAVGSVCCQSPEATRAFLMTLARHHNRNRSVMR